MAPRIRRRASLMAACIANLPGISMELISMATASVLAIGQVRCRHYLRSAARIPEAGCGWDPINHPKRNDWLVRNRIIDECQRTEPGIDGLARTNLRFSSQGGP